MVRLCGKLAILVAVSIISFKLGQMHAMFWGDPWDLAVSARLRLLNATGLGP